MQIGPRKSPRLSRSTSEKFWVTANSPLRVLMPLPRIYRRFHLASERRAVGFSPGGPCPQLLNRASNTIPLAAAADTLPKRGGIWQATRIDPGANYHTFMPVFTVATSLVEMNSTARLSPPAFIPALSAALMGRSISSFRTLMLPRPAQALLLPAV